MASDVNIHFGNNPMQNIYWNQVIYWPLKLVVVSTILFLIWKLTKEKQPYYGVNIKNFSFKPYFLMLLIMVPLVAAASTQPDFLAMYPKLKSISFLKDQHNNGLYKLLYELSYGSDFVSIELFFRGFLVLAFAKWFGKDAILPMACFYCTIHFGKPLGECISSFFGGLILGVVIYHTRTLFGGLMVHLGIAWMMELGGYLGDQFL
jgi:membrane protease YdiL (CAAX protease family)